MAVGEVGLFGEDVQRAEGRAGIHRHVKHLRDDGRIIVVEELRDMLMRGDVLILRDVHRVDALDAALALHAVRRGRHDTAG